jgi:hypothetical protein
MDYLLGVFAARGLRVYMGQIGVYWLLGVSCMCCEVKGCRTASLFIIKLLLPSICADIGGAVPDLTPLFV